MRRALAAFCFLAIASATLAQTSPFDFTWSTYKSGSFSTVTSFNTYTLRNQSDFASYWADTTGNSASTAPKDIDWLKYEALAIHLGTRNTGGYSVSVSSIDMVTGANYNVHAVEHVPSSRGNNIQAVTSPYTIILMPRRYAQYNVSVTKETPQDDGHHGHGGGGRGGGHHHNDSDDSVYDAKEVGGRVGYFEVEAGTMSAGPQSMAMEVIHSEKEWDRFWKRISYTATVEPYGRSKSRLIDWDHHQVLVIQSGPASDLEVTHVRKAQDGFRISLMKTVASTRVPSWLVAYPYVVIELPGHTGKMDVSVSVVSGG